jgi:4-hydroxy-2-oxoheptanedioate aldolase
MASLSYSRPSEGSIRMPRIKQMLHDGKSVRVFGLGQLLSPKLIEILGEHGEFDALWLDFEHAGLTMKEIELATMAARNYGMDHFVRLPATDYATVMRPLEAGAGGVMISMVRSPADVEQAVRWAKFWPRGERGLNGGNRDGRFGLTPIAEYTAKANADSFLGVQIETAGALASLAEIAAIPDVDLLFVGPSDLSQVLGVTGDFDHPKCMNAIETIARTCADAKKPWGIFSRGPDYVARMQSWGCQLFVLAADLHVVHAGIRSVKERYAAFFSRA